MQEAQPPSNSQANADPDEHKLVQLEMYRRSKAATLQGLGVVNEEIADGESLSRRRKNQVGANPFVKYTDHNSNTARSSRSETPCSRRIAHIP